MEKKTIQNNEEMTNIMVDVETLGTGYNPVILSIGAIFFSEIKIGKEFYIEISLEDSLSLKHKVTSNTIYFWMEQILKDKSNLKLFDEFEKSSVSNALYKFHNFCTNNKPYNLAQEQNINFWAWGDADFAWLGDCFENSNVKQTLKPPWKYNRCFDLRTIAITAKKQPETEKTEVKHNALDDCLNQIRYFQNLLFLNREIQLPK